MSDLAKKLAQVTETLAGGGEARPQQLRMAEIVEQAIKHTEEAFIEAGTGTGKSLAYLVPIIRSGKKAVISTATIALQSQLSETDIPRALSALGSPAKSAIFKGRNNYLCQQKISELETERSQLSLLPNESDQLETVLEWAERTTTGDKEDLDATLSSNVWRSVSIAANECPGASRCPSGEHCFSEDARNEAYGADIIVTNHHLYGMNINAEEDILPEHEVVVFDEAHQLAETFAMTCGIDIGPAALLSLAKQFRGVSTDEAMAAQLEKAADSLASALEPFRGLACDLETEIVAALVASRAACEKLMRSIRSLRKSVNAELLAKVERISLLADKLANTIDLVLEEPKGQVMWVDEAYELPGLKLTPINVSSLIAEYMGDEKSAIFTSATLPAQITDHLLQGSSAGVERVGSPFNYEDMGLLYCPTHLPPPNSESFRPKAHEEMLELINAACGRALLLFTSFTAMREAENYLLGKAHFPILVQGDQSKSALLDEFKSKEESCLLATMSFWQGVDIPGKTLSLVIVDRIPFPRPNEPVTEARRKHAGARAFEVIDLPRAQTLLAQAAGRLIRNAEDRGVVAVLDSRLANNKSYRWKLIEALPEFRRTKEQKEVVDFLKNL